MIQYVFYQHCKGDRNKQAKRPLKEGDSKNPKL